MRERRDEGEEGGSRRERMERGEGEQGVKDCRRGCYFVYLLIKSVQSKELRRHGHRLVILLPPQPGEGEEYRIHALRGGGDGR